MSAGYQFFMTALNHMMGTGNSYCPAMHFIPSKKEQRLQAFALMNTSILKKHAAPCPT